MNGENSQVSDSAKDSRVAAIEIAVRRCRHLARARRYVDENIASPIKLADVAHTTAISPSRLSHLFRERTGMSFSEWLASRRIRTAIALMEKHDVALPELAYRSGFGSYRTFERSFKRIQGITPSRYRRRMRAQMLTKIQQNLS